MSGSRFPPEHEMEHRSPSRPCETRCPLCWGGAGATGQVLHPHLHMASVSTGRLAGSLFGGGGVNSTYKTLWEGSNARHPQLGNAYHLHRPKFSLWKAVTVIQSLTAAQQASSPATGGPGSFPCFEGKRKRNPPLPGLDCGHKSSSSREETTPFIHRSSFLH